ncbi:MAG: ATP-binding protein [Bacteroidota bacterium]
MSYNTILFISCAYLLLTFVAAFFSQRIGFLKKNLSDNSLVYALSLTVYCSAWTFYGSVGIAATTGLGFIGVYLGPTLLAPMWLFILKKIIRISNYLRITSIADFISSRYGKSAKLGALVSIVCVLIIIPYISIQLKALEFSFYLLQDGIATDLKSDIFYLDPSMLFVLIFAAFAILFGTTNLDPSEKHPGIVNVIAFEAIIKLVCFLIGAVMIIFYVFDGIGDIFSQAQQSFDMQALSVLGGEGYSYQSWLLVSLLSAMAFILLPRQFHMAVVENNSVRHVKKATWLTPLYLFAISFLVLPIAFAGKLLLDSQIEADTYLLSIPITQNMTAVALIVFIGGLAATSGMIIVSMISLSIMISNNIFLPLLLRIKLQYQYFLSDLNSRLMQLRRVLIVAVMLLSYGFYKFFSINYSIVSIGLISFAGIAQLAPAVFFGMYWKWATEKGVLIGFCCGILLWAFTMPLTNLAELGIVDSMILTDGLFGISFLRPTALFGLEGMDIVSHGTFWSLSINCLILVVVSLNSKRSPLEITQSDIFINPEKYYKSEKPKSSAFERRADFEELFSVLNAILGKKKVQNIMKKYYGGFNEKRLPLYADSGFINIVESHLSGTIGAASAKILLNHVVDQKPIDPEELIKMLDETYHVYEYSQLLEKKSKELSNTTQELKKANKQLKELDDLKNMFISNVTHELRTPITSIRSLAAILGKYEVEEVEKAKFLKIIDDESHRVSKLIDQVLDLRKIEAKPSLDISTFALQNLIEKIVTGFEEIKNNRQIDLQLQELEISTDKEKLQQILINVIGNAIKFTDYSSGEIAISAFSLKNKVVVKVKDNGIGIEKAHQKKVFERFYQVNNQGEGKHKGSGLGLAICKSYAKAMGIQLSLSSKVGEGTAITLEI